MTLTPIRSRVAPAIHRLAYVSGVSTVVARRRVGVRVLMYHGVTSEAADLFAAQIAYLADRFAIVPLNTVLERLESGSAPSCGEVALTFDDGLRNNYTVAYPILKARGVPATFFVCPGLVEAGSWLWTHEARERLRTLSPEARRALARDLGAPSGEIGACLIWMGRLPSRGRREVEKAVRSATPDFAPTPRQREQFDPMSWEELTLLDPSLITIGSHTVSHAMLTALAADEADFEIEQSRRWLERRLNQAVEHFCYPNGAFDSAVVTRVRRTYRSAFSAVSAIAMPGDDVHRLPRIPGSDVLPLLAWRMHRPTA